jgi:penicillin-binding protein 1A
LKLIRFALLAGLLLVLLATLYVVGLFWYASNDLPDLTMIESYDPPQITRVYAADGSVLGEYGIQKRKVVRVEEIPPLVLNAFVSAEDAAFYQHGGLDFFGIARAAFKNLVSMSARQGASTISQQLLKNVLLKDEPRVIRKVKEAILVDRLEQTLTKRQILGLYVNEIYFANGIYGVAEAARFYFGKDIKGLDIGEIAYLAGVINSPGNFALNRHPEAAKKRQIYVLGRLLDQGYITKAEHDRFVEAPLLFHPPDDTLEAPYVVDAVRRGLAELIEPAPLKRGGLDVHTGIDASMQRAAIAALRKNLLDYDKRHGYRPLAVLDDAQAAALRAQVASTTRSATRGEQQPVLAFSAEQTPRPLRSDEEENQVGDAPPDAKTSTPAWHTLVRHVRPDTLFYAVVVEAQKDGGLVVDLGARKGRIAFENLKWALGSKPKPAEVANRFKKNQLVVVRSGWGFEESASESDKLVPLVLDQAPAAQSALVSIDPQTRAVKALVGGFSFYSSPFNRAIQALRQPGSAFKPFVYLTAIKSHQFTAASILNDEPTTFPNPGSKPYSPQNYDGKFRGPIRLRQALANSVNVPAVAVLAQVGPDAVVETARLLGLTTPLKPTLSLALGAADVKILELVNAYATFPAEGLYASPWLIERVISSDGALLYRHVPDPRRVISREEAALMASLMQSVIQEGTSVRAKALGRPVAGKTGTTNDQIDAWFVGYSPDLVCGVWMGFDDRTPLGRGETGARAALPAFIDYMQSVLKGKPIKAFPSAPGLVYTWINPTSGLRVTGVTPDAVMEAFLPGTEPEGAITPEFPPVDDEAGKNSKRPF